MDHLPAESSTSGSEPILWSQSNQSLVEPSESQDDLRINPTDYIDDPEPGSKGQGGRPGDNRLLALAIRCHRRDDPRKTNIFRCAGTSDGCTTAWKSQNRIKRRITTHAATCRHLPRELREQLDGGLAAQAPSAMTRANAGRSVSLGKRAADPNQPSVLPLAKKARQDELTKQLDADVVHLFCVGGIPPSKVDLAEWKTLWAHAVPTYSPASSSKLEEYQIPAEAALARSQQLNHLRTCINLSITFDGQTTRRQESIYTIHIITPGRLVFLFDGHEASGDSHTANHLFAMLDEVWL